MDNIPKPTWNSIRDDLGVMVEQISRIMSSNESSASGLDSPKGKMSRTSGGLSSPMSAKEDGIGDDVPE